MATLNEVIQFSMADIQASLFIKDRSLSWDICGDLSEKVSTAIVLLEKEYGDIKGAIPLLLASYYISFLVLFFQKKGAVQAETLLAVEPLGEVLDSLAEILTSRDKHYSDLAEEKNSTAAALSRWLDGDGPLSAQRAKENIVLDLLICFDQKYSTALSSRLLNDIHYVIYSLAMGDDEISFSEKRMLSFLEDETAKVKRVIGDDSVFDVTNYGETLNLLSGEKLLQQAREELHELIGLDGIKREFEKLEAFLKIQKKREELGLPTTGLTLHFVFRGNPGTGKTTIARIIGKLFRGVGFLQKGHVEETDRSGLVAEYMGQTAVKALARAQEALDGILFIDEAYALSRGGSNSGEDAYGREAIETVLKFMEDNRRRIVVVVAGYPELMDEFIDTNPGLKSRFTRYLDFEDFDPDQLFRIMKLFVGKGEYTFTKEGEEKLSNLFVRAYEARTESFGNARYVRNVFEEMLQNQAMRLAKREGALVREDLSTLLPEDIPFQGNTASSGQDDYTG